MSGGAYDYLYLKDFDLVNRLELERMAVRLAGLGYAPDAAQETFTALYELRAAEARWEAHVQRLGPVWKAVEWWDSCDRTEEGVKEELAKMRGVE